MKHVYKILCLWLLIITAQQGAVVHELSHLYGADSIDLHVGSSGTTDRTGDTSETTCALCPVFAQAVTAPFSHAVHTPLLVRANAEVIAEPQYAAIEAAIPTPRSRGPPSLS
jgi:hypothetical protein